MVRCTAKYTISIPNMTSHDVTWQHISQIHSIPSTSHITSTSTSHQHPHPPITLWFPIIFTTFAYSTGVWTNCSISRYNIIHWRHDINITSTSHQHHKHRYTSCGGVWLGVFGVCWVCDMCVLYIVYVCLCVYVYVFVTMIFQCIQITCKFMYCGNFIVDFNNQLHT